MHSSPHTTGLGPATTTDIMDIVMPCKPKRRSSRSSADFVVSSLELDNLRRHPEVCEILLTDKLSVETAAGARFGSLGPKASYSSSSLPRHEQFEWSGSVKVIGLLLPLRYIAKRKNKYAGRRSMPHSYFLKFRICAANAQR